MMILRYILFIVGGFFLLSVAPLLRFATKLLAFGDTSGPTVAAVSVFGFMTVMGGGFCYLGSRIKGETRRNVSRSANIQPGAPAELSPKQRYLNSWLHRLGIVVFWLITIAALLVAVYWITVAFDEPGSRWEAALANSFLSFMVPPVVWLLYRVMLWIAFGSNQSH